MCPERVNDDDALRGKGRRPALADLIRSLPGVPGIYVLCLGLTDRISIVNRRGNRLIEAGPGMILYIGSAGGPGGIRSRLSRHLLRPRRRWWHIDSITGSDVSKPLFVYYLPGPYGPPAEDSLARQLMTLGVLSPLNMVGATDSREPHTFMCHDLHVVSEALKHMGGVLVVLG